MYPFFRLCAQRFRNCNASGLALGEIHHSSVTCWPWDLDAWLELNNGRTLTLFDLGRVALLRRSGISQVCRDNGWGLTVAGSTVRYRRRVTLFQRMDVRSAVIGRDARFFYIMQTMWHKTEAANSVLIRFAVTSPTGIVPTETVLQKHSAEAWSPALPDWVQDWIAAENKRTWPPEV